MVDMRDFMDAIKESEDAEARHLLLGNGFSIACDTRFDYKSLLKAADFPSDSHLPEVFKKLDTKDFEKIIRRLEDASRILPIYDDTTSAATKMAKNAEALKDILIKTIASRHPCKFDFIDFSQCRNNFLCHFLEPTDKIRNIYTLNYDLLLYWATGDDSGFLGRDGFLRDSDSGHLIWKSTNPQTVHYLHGALHLFYGASELYKYEYDSKTGDPILSQVLEAISSDRYPLFVAEGKSEEKLSKIKRNGYLHYCYNNSFSQKMKQPNHALFIFGHSLNETDDHIFKCIIEGKISRVYVSLYRDPKSGEYDQSIRENAEKWKTRRSNGNGYPLEVKFFDAESANVWGK